MQSIDDPQPVPKLQLNLTACLAPSTPTQLDAIKAIAPHPSSILNCSRRHEQPAEDLQAASFGGYRASSVEGLDLPMLERPRAIMQAASQGKLLGSGTCGAVKHVCIDRVDAALKQLSVSLSQAHSLHLLSNTVHICAPKICILN